jgi:hypothetical protein
VARTRARRDLRRSLTVTVGHPCNGGARLMTSHRVKAKIEEGLGDIYESAGELSVVMKRDVVSVQAEIILGSKSADKDGAIETIWAEMGEQTGDRVIGDCGLGVSKTYEDGRTVVLLRAQVATEALIRYVSRT